MRRFTPKNILSVALMAGLLMGLIVGMTMANVQPAAAQRPQRTPNAGGISAPQITLPAGNNLMATATALAANFGGNTDSMMATADAVLTGMPPMMGGISSDDLATWLESWSEYGLSFDAETGNLNVTVSFNEALLNDLIEAALAEVDENVSSITVDFDDSGFILISAEDVTLSSSLSGDLTLTVELTAEDGEIVVTLVQASMNGRALPPAALAELTTTLEEAFNTSLETPTGLDYSVNVLVVTDEAIWMELSLSLE